jgi:hypothetical protein
MWATRKYKRLRNHRRRAAQWLNRIACKPPWLFAHWRLLYAKAIDKSRMSGDVHVRFCESLRGQFPWATRLNIQRDFNFGA